ncbi:hypothetical protein OG500_14615 [Kitasatospora sp. NBC_01250]|uniref:hypothetical protein n=1 Tax=Kitasatospora sp. NBC_01250 TaxID=2903571 RepID=UPI002E2F56BA|nr:hypothetical protein [Kitasatospora sp. NBC_01250]
MAGSARAGGGEGTPVPEVTVVLAVRHAPAARSAALAALPAQSIRRRRSGALEVLAVADCAHGPADHCATDCAAGLRLRGWAERYPDLVRAVEPAAAGQLAELARGRYLLLLGPEEPLAAQALERLVALADRTRADVVLGRRAWDRRAIFDRSWTRVEAVDCVLSGALGAVALLRRDLLTGAGLRPRLELGEHAARPLTLAACLSSRRIAVLGGEDCLVAAEPDEATDEADAATDGPTDEEQDRAAGGRAAGPVAGPGRPRHEERLRGVAALVEVVRQLAEPGAELAVLLDWVFGWELPQLLCTDFLTLEVAAQRRLCAGVGRLVERHCPPVRLQAVAARDRLRLELACRGRVAALRRLIRYQAAYGEPAMHLVAGERAAQPLAVAAPDASTPAEPALVVQVWRGLVPVQLRRRLRRQPAWRGFVNRAYARWG